MTKDKVIFDSRFGLCFGLNAFQIVSLITWNLVGCSFLSGDRDDRKMLFGKDGFWLSYCLLHP